MITSISAGVLPAPSLAPALAATLAPTLALSIAGAAAAQLTLNETPSLPNEELARRAEVVVHGTVEALDIERVLSNLFDDRTYTAEFVVDRVELGAELEPGSRIEVRYWRRDALATSVTDSVAGYMPLPAVGTSSWLFATANDDGTYTPVMPNGWSPDVEIAPDPTGLYGGKESVVRDQRTGSMTPWAIGMLAVSVAIGVVALRIGPQSRPAVLLVAAGVALSGVILLVW